LPVAPFVDGYPSRVRPQGGDSGTGSHAIIELHTATQPAYGFSGQLPFELHDVLLDDTVARVGELVR
jgi:hypothetical protein